MLTRSRANVDIDEEILNLINVGDTILTVHSRTIRQNNKTIYNSKTSSNTVIAAIEHPQITLATCIDQQLLIWNNGKSVGCMKNVVDCSQILFLDQTTIILATTSGTLSKITYDSNQKIKIINQHKTGKSISRLTTTRKRMLVAFVDGSCAVYDLNLELLAELSMESSIDDRDPAVSCIANPKGSYIGTANRSGIIRIWSSSSLFRTTVDVFETGRNQKEDQERFAASGFAKELATRCSLSSESSPEESNQKPISVTIVGDTHHENIQTDLVFLSGGVFATSGGGGVRLWSTAHITTGGGILALYKINCGNTPVIRICVSVFHGTNDVKDAKDVKDANDDANGQKHSLLFAAGTKVYHMDVDTRKECQSQFGFALHFDVTSTLPNLSKSYQAPKPSPRRIKGYCSSNGLIDPIPPPQVPFGNTRSKGKSPRKQTVTVGRSPLVSNPRIVASTDSTLIDMSEKKQLSNRIEPKSSSTRRRSRGRRTTKMTKKTRQRSGHSNHGNNSSSPQLNVTREYTKRFATLPRAKPPVWVKLDEEVEEDRILTPGEWTVNNKKVWDSM